MIWESGFRLKVWVSNFRAYRVYGGLGFSGLGLRVLWGLGLRV